MITGASQADAAVLVVAVPDGVMAQTKEHVFLSRTLGVSQLIVAMNKIDATKPPFDEKRFNEVKDEVGKLLKMVGFKLEDIPFVPISGLMGDNLSKPSANLPWYKGPTLLEALNGLKVPEKPTKLPLRVPVQDVYTISGVGTVPVGRVETGVMRKNDKIVFQPASVAGEVKSIEMHHEEVNEAFPGDNIGWNVRGVSKKDIRRGDVCGSAEKPPTVAKEFKAQIVVLQHPSAISAGYTPVFHCHTAQIACTLTAILAKLDPKSGAVKEENPAFIKAGDAAIIMVTPSKPMVIEPVKEIPQLGRFAIRDMGTTVAAGMCISVVPR
jgi:elongation factor 1-alpha